MSPPLPALVFDAASPVASVQVWADQILDLPEAWQCDAQADAGIFCGVEAALTRTGLRIADFRAFIFCEGPGSMLGIRTTAIALRTWSGIRRRDRLPEIHAYRSLELVAACLLADGQPAPFSVILDARRESWHLLEVGVDASPGAIRRVPAGEALRAVETLFRPRPFPVWQDLPESVRETHYRPERLRELSKSQPGLLRRVALPDAFVTEAPVYRKWSRPLTSSTNEQP